MKARGTILVGFALLAITSGAALACSRNTLVFFEAGSTTIIEGSMKGLRAQVKEFTPWPGPEPEACKFIVTLHGHMDTAEGVDKDSRLDIQRAEMVKKTLIEMGWPPSQFVIEGRRDRQVLVPTGPNVSELQNRRVQFRPQFDGQGRIECQGDSAACAPCQVVLPSGQRCPFWDH